MAAFFPHVWTIVLALRDFSWIAERTNAWDAVGNGAYGLLYAFLESLFLFAVSLVLGLLISRKWTEHHRVVLLSTLIFLASVGSILNQLYFFYGWEVPAALVRGLIATGRPLVFLYLLALALITPVVALPVYLVLHSERALGFASELIDRLSLLTSLYLVLDGIALILVVVRNV